MICTENYFKMEKYFIKIIDFRVCIILRALKITPKFSQKDVFRNKIAYAQKKKNPRTGIVYALYFCTLEHNNNFCITSNRTCFLL